MPPDVAPTGAAPPERGEAPLLYEMPRQWAVVVCVAGGEHVPGREQGRVRPGRSRMESGRHDHRDANANPMLDMVDLRRPAFLSPPPLARPWLKTDPGALACNVSGPGTIPPPASVSPPRKRP